MRILALPLILLIIGLLFSLTTPDAQSFTYTGHDCAVDDHYYPRVTTHDDASPLLQHCTQVTTDQH